LREAAGTLTGHAAGRDTAPVLDHTAAVKAIGSGAVRPTRRLLSADVPEPLAAVLDHLEELGEEAPEFISTAELAEVLDFDPAWLGRRLGELGCQSTRERITTETGKVRQIRGYLTADLYAAAEAIRDDELPDGAL
jgi:S-DNA-T family DNA segregation ATPase FtsK/SpoIIIE